MVREREREGVVMVRERVVMVREREKESRLWCLVTERLKALLVISREWLRVRERDGSVGTELAGSSCYIILSQNECQWWQLCNQIKQGCSLAGKSH